MTWRSARNPFFATCLFTLAVGCSQQSREQGPFAEAQAAKAKQADEPKPTVTPDDFQILDVVLVDLFDFKEFGDAVGVGEGETEIILNAISAGASGYLSEEQLYAESFNDPERSISGDLSNDLRKRNPGGKIPLTGFNPSDPRIVVRDLSGMTKPRVSSDKYPRALGYVFAWLPGYAKDRQTAVFRASFGPTAHGATLTYLLAKKDGRWTVMWRKTARYL